MRQLVKMRIKKITKILTTKSQHLYELVKAKFVFDETKQNYRIAWKF